MNRTVTLVRPLHASPALVRDIVADMPVVQVMGLDIDLGGGSSVSQRVVVELRLEPDGADESVWAISWRPQSHGRVLPWFRGSLAVTADGSLRLEGRYRVPLGVFGALVDALAGRRVAGASVERFVEGFAARVEAEARSRADHAPMHPAEGAPDLRRFP